MRSTRARLDAAVRAAAEQRQSAEALAAQRAAEMAAVTAKGQQLMQDNSELLVAKSRLETQLAVYAQAGPVQSGRETALMAKLEQRDAEWLAFRRRGSEYCEKLRNDCQNEVDSITAKMNILKLDN